MMKEPLVTYSINKEKKFSVFFNFISEYSSIFFELDQLLFYCLRNDHFC